MTPVTIGIKENGPYVISPEDAVHLQVLDPSGNPIPLPEGKVKLCRCGGSARKPFCDGQHSKIGFLGAIAAVTAATAAPEPMPGTGDGPPT